MLKTPPPPEHGDTKAMADVAENIIIQHNIDRRVQYSIVHGDNDKDKLIIKRPSAIKNKKKSQYPPLPWRSKLWGGGGGGGGGGGEW